jgi:septum formation protein
MPIKRRWPEWILASASPRRSEILDRLGIEFTVDPSGIREPAQRPGEAPSRYAVRIARLKAEEVAKRHTSGLILSADTIVVLGKSVLGKPENRAEACSMLKRLSGRWHQVISGICLVDCKGRRTRCTFATSRIRFRRLLPSEIEWYLETGEYCDKAGAYGIQGCASLFVDRIEGCYFNIVGFPIAKFERLCQKAGIDLIGVSNRFHPHRSFSRSSLKKVLPKGSTRRSVD